MKKMLLALTIIPALTLARTPDVGQFAAALKHEMDQTQTTPDRFDKAIAEDLKVIAGICGNFDSRDTQKTYSQTQSVHDRLVSVHTNLFNKLDTITDPNVANNILHQMSSILRGIENTNLSAICAAIDSGERVKIQPINGVER